MALYHFSAKTFSRGSRNTVSAVAYRAGCKLYNERTGQSFDYRYKDVEHVELLLPKDAPSWAVEIQKLIAEDRQKGVQAFVDIVEAAEKRVDARIWREFEFALHRELTKEQNMALAREFVQDQMCSRGMAAQLNFHFDGDKEMGEGDYPQEKPHCHVLLTTRRLDEAGMEAKERDWDKKELLCELRQQWQEYSNFHLKLHGHDVQIDHRSHKERGIEIEPQPKMGKGVLEMERRAQALEGGDKFSPITDKAKEFHDIQLRNLYRIMRRPEVVLEIVSKHNATFMWTDVQKVLHRYVDELPLFQKLEAKLKNSNELMLLKAGPEGHDIYTTRSMLKAEKSLVETAEMLGESKSHSVKEHSIYQAILKANEELKDHGGLSSDQKQAIFHMADDGQLRCMVGIAGAGKTTALGVCHDIWKAEGYKVYGLAPTGKAAQNLETKSLEQSGIPSNTLHKFLKEVEGGRCQYNEKSVLVLDEAGMVDMERFEKLLGAVNQLGVKLIVVGDGAQLQPVEAGPAFRLVTTRLGKSELNTVLRQKEDWQKEATVLFGKQETQEAIQKYADKGHIHIVEERLPATKNTLYDTMDTHDREDIVKLYEVSSRTSSLIYREMMRDINKTNPEGSNYSAAKHHQDFERYLGWKEIQKSSAAQILKEGETYRPLLEERTLDPTKMAMLFVDKSLDKAAQQEQAVDMLKKCGLDSLVGLEKSGLRPRQSIDVRQDAKTALIQSWHTGFKDSPDKTSLMLAFSNRDVNDLNQSARTLLKESGHISKDEITYTIAKRVEDDFGREHIIKEDKNFSKGDRIVFTRNTKSLVVKNGTMGTITDLNKQTVQVKLDDGKEISFAPNLNPYFDQGWAITIHKSQGTTVDQTYLLASFEMTQNLAYVAMTRHRDDVQVFGSSLDFWRAEKLPEALAKSGEKLSPGDYLDADSLNKLMQEDDRLLTKIFERVSNELDAMGTVSKKAFWQVADHFLGINREKEIRVTPEISQSSIREEVREEEILKNPITNDKKPLGKLPAISGEKVFEKLIQQCAQKLYATLGEERRDFTPDLNKDIDRQAERAANFIFHTHTLKGTRPTEKQAAHFLERAKYELDRIPEIRDEIIAGWKKLNSYKSEKDELIAHMIAERQASVEGRMCLEIKQRGLTPTELNPGGLTPSSTIPDLAKEEIKQNRATTVILAEKLVTKQRLSELAATQCAKDIIRYMETHGQKPTAEQMSAMAQISRDLDKQGYDHSIGSHNIEYLRWRDGDLRLRDWSASSRNLEGFRDFPHAVQDYTQSENRTKSYAQEQSVHAQEENLKSYEMDFSM
ncbi:MAG: AAA family ATPase [Alphaproteobacteria bacterium]|nr:AAA family ATPase [Alphaproteobacteria bacterium]